MKRENRWRSFWVLIVVVIVVILSHVFARADQNPFSGARWISVTMIKQHHWPGHHHHRVKR
jgi:hypothetical protein